MKRFWDIFRRKHNEPQQPPVNYNYMPMQQPQPVPPVNSFVVDEQRHQVIMALLQGAPFFAIYQTPTELKTMAAIRHDLLTLGIKQLASENVDFSEDLLNVVIDINTKK